MKEARPQMHQQQHQVTGAGRPVVEVIRELRAGTISGRGLDGESRRSCVSYLASEGYGVAEIAALLGVSDRTVTRDRARVREDLAVERDPMLLPRTVGHLMAEAEGASVRLRRIARDKGTPAAARVEAERAGWSVLVDLVRLLQSLGYLPQAPRPVSARVRFGQEDDGDAPGVDELIAELTRIEAIAGAAAGGGGDGGGETDALEGADHARAGNDNEIGTLRSDLGRLAVAARIAAIGRLVDDHTTRKDSSHDDEPEEQFEDRTQRGGSGRSVRRAAGGLARDRRAQAGRNPRAAGSAARGRGTSAG